MTILIGQIMSRWFYQKCIIRFVRPLTNFVNFQSTNYKVNLFSLKPFNILFLNQSYGTSSKINLDSICGSRRKAIRIILKPGYNEYFSSLGITTVYEIFAFVP